jgi:hypothetical protein
LEKPVEEEKPVKLPSLRISWVMTAVAIIALNLGGVRALSRTGSLGTSVLVRALPMADILVVAYLVGRRSRRPFFLGFEAFGVAALVGYVASRYTRSSPTASSGVGPWSDSSRTPRFTFNKLP